jgi:hypothetical protein
MTAPDGASWVAALRTVLGIVEAHPEVQVPAVSTGIGGHTIYWWLYGGDAARHMAVLEQALPCELAATTSSKDGEPDRYLLNGDLGGFKVEISAPAEHVATVTVTRETVEKREWTRKPVEPQETTEGGTS